MPSTYHPAMATPAVFAPAAIVTVPLPYRLRSSLILVFPGPIGFSLLFSDPFQIRLASRLLLSTESTGSARRHAERETSLTYVRCGRQYRHELGRRAPEQLP